MAAGNLCQNGTPYPQVAFSGKLLNYMLVESGLNVDRIQVINR